MSIVSFFQLKYKFHEGIAFWGSVLVTDVSPNVRLLGSQTGIIVSVYSACFPTTPLLIMAVGPVLSLLCLFPAPGSPWAQDARWANHRIFALLPTVVILECGTERKQ